MKAIFKDSKDRYLFLEILKKTAKKYNWLCHAYCLMDNHYHLVIETPDGNLSQGMRQLNGVYTQMYNKTHSRVGHLFQGRYKAIIIEKEAHLLEVSRYVVLNPLRAKMIDTIGQWEWSSYNSTAGKSKKPEFLSTDWVLAQFGAKRADAEKKYERYVSEGINMKTVWGNLKGQSLLGSDEFTGNLLQYVRGSEKIKEIPRKQRYVGRPALKKLFEMRIKNKEQKNKQIEEAVIKYGYSQIEVAGFLGVHYSTISRAIKVCDSRFKT